MSTCGPMEESEFRSIINRQYRLPTQLERARERLAELEQEQAWNAFSAEGRPIRSERHWRLPTMIANTKRKIAALENEARRYGMDELVLHQIDVNHAWDIELRGAQISARLNGGSVGFCEDER